MFTPIAILASGGALAASIDAFPAPRGALAAATPASRSGAIADAPDDCEHHVRTASPELRSLIAEASQRSERFHSLMDRIDNSDLVVYVAYHLFTTNDINGRLVFLTSAGGHRYVLIQIACLRTREDQFAILGHELHHATEIAAAPSITNSDRLARHYTAIGVIARRWPHGLAFETQAAVETGSQVQREVLESERRGERRQAPRQPFFRGR